MRPAHQTRYSAARAAFLDRLGNASHTFYEHPSRGPDGTIGLDVAYWPGADTGRVLVVSSATHGGEGYCGSFVQCSLLDDDFARRAGEHFSLLMIHAVNPFGFAWVRRVNENNVDLNRNFIDFSQPLPVHPAYDEIAAIVEPSQWAPDTAAGIMEALTQAASRHPDDPRWLQAALSRGQYAHPHGQFYGGDAPQWSNARIREIAARHLAGRQVIWVDVHTALGPYGTAECIVELDPASRNFAVAHDLWGERLSNMRTTGSVSVAVVGSMIDALAHTLGPRLLATALEIGTREQAEVIGALIEDQWLHRYGETSGEVFERVKRRMMDTFYPDDSVWRASVLEIARAVTDVDRVAAAFGEMAG
ncbi:MAG: DUF2817 domain-containing protein [Burkholderiaceae bacterium]